MTTRYFLNHMHTQGMTKDDVVWLLGQYGLTSPDELNADTVDYLLLFASVRRKYGSTLQEAWTTFIQQ
jgi:hypothetical protein